MAGGVRRVVTGVLDSANILLAHPANRNAASGQRPAVMEEKLMLLQRRDAGGCHDFVVISSTEVLALVRENRERWIAPDWHVTGADTRETAFGSATLRGAQAA